MIDIFQKVKGRLIVSCQAEEGSPFNSPEGVGAFAQCAAQGGAAGIRSCGIEKTDYLIRHSRLPVIGLTKSHFARRFCTYHRFIQGSRGTHGNRYPAHCRRRYLPFAGKRAHRPGIHPEDKREI